MEPNSAETCKIEAQGKRLRELNEVAGTRVAPNATYVKGRHIRHQPLNPDTAAPQFLNTAPRKSGDLDGECLTSANGVRDDDRCRITAHSQSRRHGIGSL